jgi:hypothetical protein
VEDARTRQIGSQGRRGTLPWLPSPNAAAAVTTTKMMPRLRLGRLNWRNGFGESAADSRPSVQWRLGNGGETDEGREGA